MKKLFKTEMSYKIRSFYLSCFILAIGGNAYSQQGTTVLPNNASYSNKTSPQGALRYQRGFYLITPAEMNNSGITPGMNINSIGFTIGRAQNDTTHGRFRLFLQNTADVVSRADTGWNTVSSATNEYNAIGLFPGKYEWQVRANCTGSSAFTSSVFFFNDELSGCNNPYNLNTISITTNAATLTWESATSPGFVNYMVEYTATDVINWISANTSDTFYNVSGLLANKSYQWRVKTVCSTTSSAINSSSFFTNATSNCNLPSGLSSAVTQDSLVALSWNAAAGALYYEVQFRRKGTSSWSPTSSFSNSANLVLPVGTTYQWRVRTICDPGPSGDFVSGTDFTTGGTTVCYEPTVPTTRNITSTSARLTWTPVVGATGYTTRYRLKNTISWVNAVTPIAPMTPMTLTCDSLISIPDTTGAYDIPFHGGSPFTYTGGGVYVAWEYSRPAGNLSTTNLTLSTTRGTSTAGANGQDSVTFLLCMLSRADTTMTGLPNILGESRQRPETRFGSPGLKDSVAVVAVYALGMTAPKFQSPTPISALITNRSATNKTYNVTLTVKEQQSGAVRYTITQNNVAVPATDTVLVSFNGWSPSLLEKDSIIISIPAEPNENVLNNNSKSYFQDVNTSFLAYDDGTALVSAAGFGTGEGLLLNKHTLSGCGQVIAAKVYLTESAEGMPLHAVIRNTAGGIVAQSPVFTAANSDINKYHSFYFTTPAPFSNEDFYIGIAQAASATAYYPVGSQWEDAATRDGAYFHANLNGTNLSDHPEGGRLMIRAEIGSSVPEVFINGNLTLCSPGSNVLTAGSASTRYANSIIGYSSQYATNDYSALQTLGTPNVYPAYGLSPNAWISVTAQGQREYLVLGFPNPGKINFVDIFETANPGAVDSIWAKDPASPVYNLVYFTTATAAPLTSRKNHISFTETLYDVSEIRIALNSPAVPGHNAIDAVGIGKEIVPGTFTTYLWSPGGETTQTKTVNLAGTHTLTVTNGSGCQSSTSVTVVNAVTTAPVITAGGPTSFCPGGSVVLTSSITSGIIWSTGATTPSITVNAAGSYSVTYNGGSCGALISSPVSVSINAVPTVAITGSLQICLGNQNTLDAGAGFSSYLWSTGQTSQTILISSAGIYSVTVTNALGCTASASVTAIYATLPAPVITGNLSFCPGGSTVLDAGTGYISYLWSTGAITRTITVLTTGDFNVTVTNAGGCTASASVLTSLFTPPVPNITGAAGFCAGGSTTLTAPAGYATYLWSTGSVASSITVNTSGTYIVTVTDNNGCTGSKSVAVSVFPSPVPVISGTLSFCGGTSTTLNAGPGYSSYLWSTGATTQIINVNTVASFTVTVTNANGCSATASATTTNTGSLPAVPGPISGPSLANCSSTGNIYSIAAVPNTSHYVWSVPVGATIISGQRTTSISVNYGPTFQGGNIVVAASNACGQSPSIVPRKLFVQSLANAPGTITGQASGLCGPTTKTYSIATVPTATSYTWSAPSGASIVSGQGTTVVSVLFGAGFSYGNICVTANNACGSTIPSCKLLSGVLPTPGAIRGPTAVCRNQSNLLYEIDPVAGATSYTWTVPQSAQIFFGQGSTNIVVKMGPNAGNITVKANSACGSGGLRVLPITLANCLYAPPIFTMKEIRPVPEVVSNYGGSATAGNLYFEWTLGEPRIELFSKPDYLFTQGFHQPLVYVIPVKQTDTTVLVASDKIKIIVYPNPISTVLKVKIEMPDTRPLVVDLGDVNGRLLQRKNIAAGLTKHLLEFGMTGYIGGAYYLIVKDANGTVINTIKLVKVD